MVSVAERQKEKIRRVVNWENENPGLSWCNPEHPEKEAKIYITKETSVSEAFRSLSRVGMLLYMDFLAKRIMKPTKRNGKKFWITENNGQIVYEYSEAIKNGFSRAQFVKGIDELQQKGFLDITHQGRGGRIMGQRISGLPEIHGKKIIEKVGVLVPYGMIRNERKQC